MSTRYYHKNKEKLQKKKKSSWKVSKSLRKMKKTKSENMIVDNIKTFPKKKICQYERERYKNLWRWKTRARLIQKKLLYNAKN